MTLIPCKRVGLPVDILKAVLWLGSDHSDYVNGQSFVGRNCGIWDAAVWSDALRW